MTITTNNLSTKAMLAHLRTSSYTGKTKDQKVAGEVTRSKNAKSDAASVIVHLLPPAVINRVESARLRVRNQFFEFTLPWMDGGLRILPSARFMEFSKAMREIIAEYDEEVEIFLKDYARIVREAPTRLGRLITNKRYPAVSEIRSRYHVTLDVMPMPTKSDFRCQAGLSDTQMKDITKKFENSMKTMTGKAMENLWEQFTELVGKVQTTMKQPKKVFRDSLISNLKDFCETIPKMNVADDTKMESIRKEVLKKLANLKPIDLRESKVDRKKAANEAKKLLDKMKGYNL